MKSFLVTIGSLALSMGVIGNAFVHKKQFYPSVVYLTKSNPSMAVRIAMFVLKVMFMLGSLFASIGICCSVW